MHAFDDLDFGFHRLGFFDRDDAFVADLLHRLAIMLPMVASPLAETVPTWATSADELTFLARFSMSLTTAATAMSMPRLRSIGFMPAATDLAPSRTIACASTVAVVVPSPA